LPKITSSLESFHQIPILESMMDQPKGHGQPIQAYQSLTRDGIQINQTTPVEKIVLLFFLQMGNGMM
jgi:hypothetical protein